MSALNTTSAATCVYEPCRLRGLASKMGPGDLAQVLRLLVSHTHPNLIIGLAPGDDAAVYLISESQAIVQTLHFFPPTWTILTLLER